MLFLAGAVSGSEQPAMRSGCSRPLGVGVVALAAVLVVVWLSILFTLLDLCVSSLRRGHANLLCIVPI